VDLVQQAQQDQHQQVQQDLKGLKDLQGLRVHRVQVQVQELKVLKGPQDLQIVDSRKM
jgi:hypothetical protein